MRKQSTQPPTHTFEAAYGSFRLDQLLAREECIKSRVVARELIEAGSVRVDGTVVKKGSRLVSRGSRVEVQLPEVAAIPEVKSSKRKLEVLFEDERCMVIEKPAGISVHPGTGMEAGTETILDALKPLFAKRKLSFSPSEVLVHRLDKDTTGCLLIAKNPASHLALQKQFASRTVKKTYVTIVYGVPKFQTATIDAPIGRHATERTKMSIHRAVNTRSAQTTYRILASGSGASVLECDLHTGRTHQIRVHLSSISHPVLGDETYGNRASIDFAKNINISTMCLHAAKLSFRSGAKKISVQAPLPPLFQKSIKALKIKLSA